MQRNSLDAAPRSAEALDAIQREQSAKARIEVAPELTDPHPLVAKSLAPLTKAGLKAKGIIAKRRCLDVVVSSEHVPRALRIMDALLKAFVARGYKVEVTDPVLPPERPSRYDDTRPKPATTGVHVGGVFITFRIEEVVEAFSPPQPEQPRFRSEQERIGWQITHPRPAYEHRSTGRLVLRLTEYTFLNPPRQTWRDGKRHRLEDMLNDFVAGVLDLAERHRLWEEERERQQQAWRAAEQQRLDAERRRRLEERRVADLERRIACWRSAKDIDGLIQAVESETSTEDGAARREWLEWARARANALRSAAASAPALLQDTGS